MIEYYKDNYIVSISLLIILIFYFFKPKTINSWYGYSIYNSFKSQKKWTVAQKCSSKQALVFLTIVLILQYPIYRISNDNSRASLINTVVWLISMIFVIILIENRVSDKKKLYKI